MGNTSSTLLRAELEGMSKFMRHILSTVWSKPHGKLLLAIWSSYFITVFSLRSRKRRKSRFGNEKHTKSIDDGNGSATQQRVWYIVKRVVHKVKVPLLLYLLAIATRIVVTVKLTDLVGEVGGMFSERRWDAMFSKQAVFGLFCVCACIHTATMKYLKKRLALSVRFQLFERLRKRFMDPKYLTFYHVKGIEDAPARLTTDLAKLSTESVHVLGHISKPLVDIAFVSYTLWKRLGFLPLASFYGYFYLANWMLGRIKAALPRSLNIMNTETLMHEARLRDHQSRVQTYREQIAFQGGTEWESRVLHEEHMVLLNHDEKKNKICFALDTVTSYVLKYGGMMCAFTVLIPDAYFGASSKVSSATITARYLSNSALLGAVATAVEDLATSYKCIAELKSLAERMAVLDLAVDPILDQEKHSNQSVLKAERSDDIPSIYVENLSVNAGGENVYKITNPSSKSDALFQKVSFEVKKGQNTLVSGPNGVGKTSLFRTLAGLWSAKYFKALRMPSSLFVLPQDCYFTIGSLLEQVIYPHYDPPLIRAMSACDAVEQQKLQKVSTILTTVGFPPEYSLEDERDWQSLLSGGQKQRLAFARLFYHEPQFALCDEPTSGVSSDIIHAIYAYAAELGITMVTISHQPELRAFHNHELKIDQNSAYSAPIN